MNAGVHRHRYLNGEPRSRIELAKLMGPRTSRTQATPPGYGDRHHNRMPRQTSWTVIIKAFVSSKMVPDHRPLPFQLEQCCKIRHAVEVDSCQHPPGCRSHICAVPDSCQLDCGRNLCLYSTRFYLWRPSTHPELDELHNRGNRLLGHPSRSSARMYLLACQC